MTVTNLRIARVTFVAKLLKSKGPSTTLIAGMDAVHVGVTAPAAAHLIEVRNQGWVVATVPVTIDDPGPGK